MQQLTSDIIYSPVKGFIMMSLPRPSLADVFAYNGTTFAAKSRVHVSLIGARKVAQEYDVPEDELVTVVKHFLARHSVHFDGYTGEFYCCEKDEGQTIIARAYMTGLEELYDELRQLPELSALPSPAPHVTLYKYNHQFGIAVPNEEALTGLCAPMSANAIKKLTEMIISAA